MAIQAVTGWKKEWFEIEDATYLNTTAHTVMPRVSISAVERSLEAKKLPHRVDDSLWFEPPARICSSLAKMIGAKPEEIAVTTEQARALVDGYVPMFAPFVQTDNLIYLSGRLAKKDGQPFSGKLGQQRWRTSRPHATSPSNS